MKPNTRKERYIKCDVGYQGRYVLDLKGKFFKCERGSEGLYIEYDSKEYTKISMLYHNPEPRSWYNRLKSAYACLKGKPYTDIIVLSNQTLADLVDHLVDIQNFN